MYGKGKKKGTVRIALNANGSAGSVSVAGAFNGWQAVRMKKQKDGSFAASFEAAPGSYEYKFIVDGEWKVDPDNSAWALNQYGTLNSVMVVE